MALPFQAAPVRVMRSDDSLLRVLETEKRERKIRAPSATQPGLSDVLPGRNDSQVCVERCGGPCPCCPVLGRLCSPGKMLRHVLGHLRPEGLSALSKHGDQTG